MNPGGRFVVLLHQVSAGFTRTDQSHLDWMFESGRTLRTWSSPMIDAWECPFEVRGQSLADHRAAYLDYEGPVSRDRGTVTRILQGTFTIEAFNDDLLAAQLRFSHCEHPDAPESLAQVVFQRIVVPPRDLESNEGCDWAVRWRPGSNNTN